MSTLLSAFVTGMTATVLLSALAMRVYSVLGQLTQAMTRYRRVRALTEVMVLSRNNSSMRRNRHDDSVNHLPWVELAGSLRASVNSAVPAYHPRLRSSSSSRNT